MASFTNYHAMDLSLFASALHRYGGVAKANKYAVSIAPNNALTKIGGLDVMRDLVFLCENAEFPGRTIVTSDVRYYGPVFKFPFQTSYNEVNFTFICRDGFYEKGLMDSWMEIINPVRTYDFAYKTDYATRIDIFQFSEFGETVTRANSPTAEEAAAGMTSTRTGKLLKPIYQTTLENAFPINIGAMTLNWGDDQYHRLTVTFCFDRHYRSEDIANYQ